MALRLCWKFLANESYCSSFPFSSFSFRLQVSCRLINYRNFTIIKDNPRPCVQAIMECYQNREGFRHFRDNYCMTMENETVTEERDDNVFKVVLTVRPDEFHKLSPKCSACGAILQTKNDTHDGYIKESKFVDSLNKDNLDKLICFPCYRLRYHNSPIIRDVDSNSAMNHLRHLLKQTALILYVVDLFDIEGTMLSNILQLVGEKKRLILVGNKLDRIPQDHKRPRKQVIEMENALGNIAFKNGLEESNFRDVCLISAKTGFGLKSLVEKINQHRDKFMNVYLVGCTNTGKSTLYNLLVNMMNAQKVHDLPAQAIEHHIPGTTRSLIREHISEAKLTKLHNRLNKGPLEFDEVFNFDDELLDLVGLNKKDKRYEPMGRASKKQLGKQKLLEQKNNMIEPRPLEIVDEKTLQKQEKECFLYDTPGILNTTQLVQYLTPKEINYLSPKLWVVPRTFLLKPGRCLFVGGLARLDFLSIARPPLENKEVVNEENDSLENKEVDNEENDSSDELISSGRGIYVTAMISPNIPIHVTFTETGNEKFDEWFSNNFFKLPVGSPERLKEFPKLIKHEYTILGKSRNTNACDLVLHGIGWLSVAAVWGSKVCLALHTPNGVGQDLRLNPLLPYTVQRKKGRGGMYLGRWNRNLYGHTRNRSPQLIKVLQEQSKTVDTVPAWKKTIKEKMKQERLWKKENERLERIEQGIVLGKRKALKEKEEKLKLLDEQNYNKLIENK